MKKIILLLLAVLTITSCGKQTDFKDTKNRQYNNYYDEFGISKLNEEFYSKEEKTYGVYLYGVSCKYCEYCKGAVLDYLDDLRQNKKKGLDNLYIFEREKDKDFRTYFKEKPSSFKYENDRDLYIQKMLGATSITQTYFFGTPTLYVIKNHKLNGVYVDDKEVGNYLVNN